MEDEKDLNQEKTINDKDSILISIKKLLGITSECEDFDTDIILHINTVFMILNQLGVGTEKCFRIQDKEQVWTDFISDEDNIESVKSYIYLKVRLLFDPPLSSSVIEAINQSIHELEWRLNVQVENQNEEKEG